MKPAPDLKYSNIIYELNSISRHFDKTPFLFKLNRYKEDAKKMIQNFPAEGYNILGIIACIENDLDSMHKFHQNAIRLSGEDIHCLCQYSSSLSAQDLLDEAYDYAFQAYEKAPEEQLALDRLMRLSYVMGRDDLYKDFKLKMEKLGLSFIDPDDFKEDNGEILSKMIADTDALLEKYPEKIVDPDPELVSLIEDLVEGVDIS